MLPSTIRPDNSPNAQAYFHLYQNSIPLSGRLRNERLHKRFCTVAYLSWGISLGHLPQKTFLKLTSIWYHPKTTKLFREPPPSTFPTFTFWNCNARTFMFNIAYRAEKERARLILIFAPFCALCLLPPSQRTNHHFYTPSHKLLNHPYRRHSNLKLPDLTQEVKPLLLSRIHSFNLLPASSTVIRKDFASTANQAFLPLIRERERGKLRKKRVIHICSFS